jgi:hypothetical protein
MFSKAAARRELTRPDGLRAEAFAREHGIRDILERYANLSNYVGFIATTNITKLEEQNNKPISAKYWRSKVDFDALPVGLTAQSKPSDVRKYLRRNVSELKQTLARGNYVKIDLTPSDLSSFVALGGALLLLLGYLRIVILGTYFGFSYQDYFSVSDYLTTSLNLTGSALLGCAISIGFSFAYLATVNSYSVHELTMQRQSLPGRLQHIFYHVTFGLLSLAAVVVSYHRLGYVDTISLGGFLMYVGVFGVAKFSAAFFTNPLKAFLVVNTLYVSLIATVTGTIGEINRHNHTEASALQRTLKFEDGEYTEREWQFLAFTTDYVILRNRDSKTLLVRARSDLQLKQIATPPPKSP